MSMFHDISKMSENGLIAMHRAIRDRLAEEDGLSPELPKLYGVREHADWKQQADEMEAELDRRGATYAKVPW